MARFCEIAFSLPMKGLLALLLVSIELPAAPALAARRAVQAPAPSWVTVIAPDLTRESTLPPEGGTEALLDDRQTRFGAHNKTRFLHLADRVLTAEGIDNLSPIRVQFDPSFERLQLNFVRIHRGGQTIDALRSADVKQIDVQSEIARRLFDGRRDLIIVPRALRVGDVLEWAVTIDGDNPVMGSHVIGYSELSSGSRLRRLHARIVLGPGMKPLHVRLLAGAPGPHVKGPNDAADHTTDYNWEVTDTPAVEREDRLPPSIQQFPGASYSDFASWDEVRDWALALYPPRSPSAAMADRAAQWQRAYPGVEDRALAALRFVQDDIRYLGFELGPNSYAPHPPDRVFTQRFGDCKDKSYLLVTLLRGMGIDAQPALVNSDRYFDPELPTPYAFDHVIVRASINGRVYWMDPTDNLQGGTLQTQVTPALFRALVVRAGQPVLETIPEESAKDPTEVVLERYEVASDGTATLAVTTIFQRSSADHARLNNAGADLAKLDRAYLNFYAKNHPSIRSTGRPRIEDDRTRNLFVIREAYAIPEFWQDRQSTLRAHSIGQELALEEPHVRLRKMPLAARFPRHLSHEIDVLLPEPFDIDPVDERIQHDGVEFHRVVTRADRRVSMRYSYASTEPEIAPENVASHLAALTRVSESLDYQLRTGTGVTRRRRYHSPWLGVAGLGVFALIGGLAWLMASVVRRVRLRAFRRLYEPTAGEMATAAIEIHAVDEAAPAGERVPCACGGRMTTTAVVLETSRLGDREVHSSRFRCNRCGSQRPLYFRITARE